ncbi:unnamed protein product [Cylindrotheca closterium]|uniref:non-specific serine/threonine protein kinase n=1 Tax=Cylindrotheca closterium TaxID=2856 RepID=A0AAD2CFC3_9STRA|nr:unnamed protein product [Cylindrotheca closterium]
MDATSTISRSSEEDPIMKSDHSSKTSTEEDDSSADASSTERGYRRCLQKYSKYLPGGEMEQIMRVKAYDEHDDIISKDDDSISTTERYKQFMIHNNNNNNNNNGTGGPDEGDDDQPIEIIIPKSRRESQEAETMQLDANEDFHRWVSPDGRAAASKDDYKPPKQTSNLLPNEDMDVVNQMLGAESDNDDDDSDDGKKKMGKKGNSRDTGKTPRVANRTDGEVDTNEATNSENHDHIKVNRPASNSQIPAAENQKTSSQLTSNVLGNEDMEMVNMMLGDDDNSDDDSSPDEEDEERAFQETYPNVMWNIPDDEDVAENDGTPKSTNRRLLDSSESDSRDKRFTSDDTMMSMTEVYDEEIPDHQGSETHRWGNTRVAGYISDPSVTEESLPGFVGATGKGTPFNNHSDSGESSIMTSDDSLSPVPIAKPPVPKQQPGDHLQQEGLPRIEESDGASPNLVSEDPTPQVENAGTPFNPNSDSGESTILTSDDSAMSISPIPIAKPPIPKQQSPKEKPSSIPAQEELTSIDEGAALLRSTPDLEDDDGSMPQVVENDPWVRMMERRDMRIDHMDTDFLCLWSKPSVQKLKNVIGNNSFSEDETIESQHDIMGAPMTPEALLGSDDEDALLESKLLVAHNPLKVPDISLQTRHIQGTRQANQGSPQDVKSNTRQINSRDGSMSSNANDRTAVTNDQIPPTGEDDDSQSSFVGGPQHQQARDIENAIMGNNNSVTVRRSGAGSRMNQSPDFTHSVVSSNGWESTASSSLGDPYEDLENAGVESDDDGPPHLFSDEDISLHDEYDPLTPAHTARGGVNRSRHSEVIVSLGPNRPAPRSSEITVVRGSRTKKNDPDALVRERHDIATGRTSGNSSRKRQLAPQERGMSPRKMHIIVVLFVSFILGAATFWYIWANYLTDDDTEAQAVQGPAIQTTPPPTVRETETPSYSPSSAPTKSPSEILRDLLVFVWPSLESNFSDSTSPQFKALVWLQDNLNIDSYGSQQKIQRFALATLFYSTNGNGWTNKGSWLTDADECEWNTSNSFRPPCNEEGLYVYLELRSNGLSGTVPSEIALLSNSLVRLEMSQDGIGSSAISGSIPPELGELTLLESISLANNAFSGTLPAEIGKWTKATAVDVRGNELRGAIPIDIFRLTSLTSLSLERNQFTLLPRQIGDLSALKQLDASFNRIGYLPPEIGNLRLLRRLDISNNQIESPIPSTFGKLMDLISLDLSSNLMVETIPSNWNNTVRLRDLDLSDNRLSGSIPSELSRATLLRNLILHDNNLSGTIPTSFGALSRLATFRVEANNLTGIVSTSICNVFNESVPAFISDCIAELDCPCCMFCCEDPGVCQCQLEGELEFLCSEYTTTFAISSSGLLN